MELSENIPRQERNLAIEERKHEEILSWFDMNLQVCAIEEIVRRTTPDSESLDHLDRQQRGQLRLGIITSGFSTWYREEKISQRFTENSETFSKIAALHEKHLQTSKSKGEGSDNARLILEQDFLEFSKEVADSWQLFHQSESSMRH